MFRHLGLIVGLLAIHSFLSSGIFPRIPGPPGPVAAFQQGAFEVDDRFITGLSRPTAMAFAPDGRLFVTQQAGAVRVISAEGQLLPAPFLTLSNIISDRENGLLGLALDPDFASNRYIYIYATDVFGHPILSGLTDMCVERRRFAIRGDDECWQRGHIAAGFYEVDTRDQPRWTLFLTGRGP